MFLATMQQQSGTYQTKTRRCATQADVDKLIDGAKRVAVRVVYETKFDGMDHGLWYAGRFASSTTEYVLTIHKQ